MSTQPSHQNCPALAKLKHGHQYRLVLFVAPDGAGKAKIIQEWVDQSENLFSFKAIYIPIETEDNQLDKFLGKIIRNIKSWDPNIEDLHLLQHTKKHVVEDGIELKTTDDPEIQPSIEIMLNELINRLTNLAGDRFLIMFNYHHINDLDIHAMVTYLIDYLPPNLQMVITSQNTPPLQIPRLRARRQLLEIGPGDLK